MYISKPNGKNQPTTAIVKLTQVEATFCCWVWSVTEKNTSQGHMQAAVSHLIKTKPRR